MAASARSPRSPASAAAADAPEAAACLLSELPRGRRARVEAVLAEEPIGERLRELGFLPGTEVALVRRAPLGDPAVYRLRGMQLCLRRGEAATIRVRPFAPARDAG